MLKVSEKKRMVKYTDSEKKRFWKESVWKRRKAKYTDILPISTIIQLKSQDIRLQYDEMLY